MAVHGEEAPIRRRGDIRRGRQRGTVQRRPIGQIHHRRDQRVPLGPVPIPLPQRRLGERDLPQPRRGQQIQHGVQRRRQGVPLLHLHQPYHEQGVCGQRRRQLGLLYARQVHQGEHPRQPRRRHNAHHKDEGQPAGGARRNQRAVGRPVGLGLLRAGGSLPHQDRERPVGRHLDLERHAQPRGPVGGGGLREEPLAQPHIRHHALARPLWAAQGAQGQRARGLRQQLQRLRRPQQDLRLRQPDAGPVG